MKKIVKQTLIAFLLFCFPVILVAASKYKVLNGPERFYFGYISLIEAKEGVSPKIIVSRIDGLSEAGVLNLPITPGDTIRTPDDARCEVQFDSGTVVRLDYDSELKIETIMARSLSAFSDISNLVLIGGQIYLMYKQYDRGEMMQVLTQNTAAKLFHNTVAVITTDDRNGSGISVRYGKIELLYGKEENKLSKKTLKKGESIFITPDGQVSFPAANDPGDFIAWNDKINASYEELHKGITKLPRPVQNLPGAVFYFAQKYGYYHGEWLWDDYYGYVWRPFINDRLYPWGWQPYIYGRWSYVNGQLFWVPEEPWGWVPYHLGIWQWDKKLGWVWIPGSLFAPAWVSWDFFFGYATWRPWTLFDWVYFVNPLYWTNYVYLPGENQGSMPPVERVIRKDQLKKPASPASPVPHEIKPILSNVISGLKRNEERIVDSAGGLSSWQVFVKKEDVHQPEIQKKIARREQLSEVNKESSGSQTKAIPRPVLPGSQASRIFLNNKVSERIEMKPAVSGRISSDEADMVKRASRSSETASNPAVPRREFRRSDVDWNPDVKIARELGVKIQYESVRNEIRCPELNLSSSDRLNRTILPGLSPRGVVYQLNPIASSSEFVPNSSSGNSDSSVLSPRVTPRETDNRSSAGSTRAPDNREKK